MSAADNPQIRAPITQAQAAKMMNVSLRSGQYARVVRKHGIPELSNAVWSGEITVSAAAWIARHAEAEQRRLIQLPSPTQARRQARKTGRPIEARNGKTYDERTADEARADKAVSMVFAAVEILATTPISTAEGLSQLPDSLRRKFAGLLPAAVEFLNHLTKGESKNDHP